MHKTHDKICSMKLAAFGLPLALSISLYAGEAQATRTVTSPYVDEGVLKIKGKGGVTHDDDNEARDGALDARLAVEYGFTDFFSLEAEGNVSRTGDSHDTDHTTTTLKAKFQLTEKGAYWLDAGARLSYEVNHQGDPDSVELKLMLAKDGETYRHVANIMLDREVGDGASDDTGVGLSWSSRYKWHKAFEPGFELYNNFGSLSDGASYDEQDHSIGPVVYGRLTDRVKYEAGYLVGISDSAVDGRFKAVVEYAVPF